MRLRPWFTGAALAALSLPAIAHAGVVNPDISVIGQPLARWTDDASSSARKRATLDVAESELVFDAALNPYARGMFVVSLADGAAEVEEAYFTMLRGLPAGLELKGGKYRAGFGKLNPQHPHTYPFAERFRVLAAYLPGDEAMNETGVQLSSRLPAPGDVALTASLDALQGDSFRITREPSGAANDPLALGDDGDRASEPRTALLGRLSAFVPIRDRSGLELGVSGTQGTNNVAAATRTTVFGGDAKLKWWTSASSYVLVQGELLRLDREDAGWDELAAAYTRASVKPAGAYVFADYNWATRYNVGASFERYQQPIADKASDQAFGLFAGLALLEESTAFRIGWEHVQPGRPSGVTTDPDAINTVSLRVIYSMGPHKAHQF